MAVERNTDRSVLTPGGDWSRLLAAIAGNDDNLLSASGLSATSLCTGVAHDSRRVVAGDLFVAIVGAVADGHNHIDAAANAGAVAVVAERDVAAGRLPVIRVRSTRRALGRIARLRWKAPSAAMRVIAITGTNGKSSVAWGVSHVLRTLGTKTGLLSTVRYDTGRDSIAAPLTTPDALMLQELLARMHDAGCRAVLLEASSHGLELDRLEGCDLHLGVFTNLSRDHLDYHGEMESYRRAKLRLIDLVRRADAGGERRIVFNADDPAWSELPHLAADLSPFAYSVDPQSAAVGSVDLYVEAMDLQLNGTRYRVYGRGLPIDGIEGRTPLVGRINLENTCAVLATCAALGVAPQDAARALTTVSPVPGRMECVVVADAALSRPAIMVDYAHTPDAIARVLADLRPLTIGRLIVVFGCGGDRDRGKRPLMGRAATAESDLAILTNDNPRTEDPRRIFADVLAGTGSRRCEVIPDRRAAIRRAIDEAGYGDLVVILGKGHETVQIVGEDRLPFDDRQVVKELVRERFIEDSNGNERRSG